MKVEGTFNFQKLEVWQEAIRFADDVYGVTKHFPKDERFGLVNQMRRAAVSISSNLAEGASRHSKVDFARFVEIAVGSTFEVVSQAHIARAQDYLGEEDFRKLCEHADKISRMCSGLRKSLKSNNG
jgi:four helix bundle protein